MNLRNFIVTLSGSFGIAWLLVIVVPYFTMQNLPLPSVGEPGEEEEVFQAKRTGRVEHGSRVYAENGCYLCHTQVVRPTYAGNDMYRADWGGLAADEIRGDTRRETNAFDFIGERFAHIGLTRTGPDLSNVGRRVEALYGDRFDAETWLMIHLYDARLFPERRRSNCPPMRFLFTEREVQGNRSVHALPIGGVENIEIVPTSDARALVSYLLSLKKDQEVPAALNFSPTPAGGER